MTDLGEDPLEVDAAHSQSIPKPWVIPAPKGNEKRIFGTSLVFYDCDDVKPKPIGLTVPLKVREYYQQGHRCLEQEDWEMAVLFFSRALHLDPKLVDFYALRAEAFIQLCDFSSAVQNLRRAYSSKPDNSKYLERLTFVLYLQGQCLYEQCDFQDALNVFLQGSELQPQKPCFRYRCMACLLALKRHQDCLSLITKELKQDLTNPDIYILRARIYNFFQKPDLCYRDLRSALLLDPKHRQAKVLLQMMVDQANQARQDAAILAVQGKLQHSLQRINCAIENNPLDPSLFLFRGTIYRRLQEFDAAVEDFLKALDMVTDGQHSITQQAQRQLLLAYNDFAVHCYTHGAYQEGVLLLNKALKDEQREKGLYINRGDCFFQLGNLPFAEADYKQALALSPQDEGANMRMGMLQEKMGFCEQQRRQFQKAEDHFSVAIKHNPQRAQYYLYRAKSRQLLQDVFGARQDVATVLLLNPKQPKLFPLMTNLFPGMSAEEVLRTQVANVARLQLERLVESRPHASCPPSIVGVLRERELQRQKAQRLQLSWKKGWASSETSKELEATPKVMQISTEGSGEEAEAPRGKKAEKKAEAQQKPPPRKVTSLSDSYLDQASSGSLFHFRTTGTSESETSPGGRKYRSSSTTTGTWSDSSLLKTQSSLSSDKEDLGVSRGPRKARFSQGWRQSSSNTQAAHGQKPDSNKTEAAQGQSQSPSKTEATHGPKHRPSSSKASQSPRKRLRKTKAARGQSWRPNKAEAPEGQSCGLTQTSSKAKASHDPACDPGSLSNAKDQSQRPSKAEAAPSRTQNMSSNSNVTDAPWRLSSILSKIKTPEGQSQSPKTTSAGQATSHDAAL